MRGADPQLAALPLAEPHLAQLGDHDRLEPGERGERRRRLGRALQRRDEQGGEILAREPIGHGPRLQLTLHRERRVALPLEVLERLAGNRCGGGAVAY